MKYTIEDISEWHKETFIFANLDGQLQKYAEETAEFMSAKDDEKLYELADMIIVSAGIMRFNRKLGLLFLSTSYQIGYDIGNYNMNQMWDAVEEKYEKNRKRVWNKTGNGTYHHENGIED